VANAHLLGPAAKRVTVPANDRVEIRFAAAAGSPGTARFQIGAVSSLGTDASEHGIKVWTPATTEAFATYGQLDQGAVAQRVRPPRGVVPQFGGLELTTSSTALQGLTDAVLYLVSYPFECNEQLASRVLAVAALRDVLKAFEAEGLPSPRVLRKRVIADIKKLQARQHYWGGWHWWRRTGRPAPYLSVHVTHALVRAKEKGFAVPQVMLRRAFSYLKNIRYRFPGWYSKQAKLVIEAYALYVQHRGKQTNRQRARQVFSEAGGVTQLPLEALGWLLPVLSGDSASATQVDAMRRHLANRVTETAGKAHFVTSYGEGDHVLLHSDRRVDGVVLEALIGDQPDSDLLPKLVKGLLAHRKRGRWYNTQENAFVLLALDRYFNTFEKVTPNFVARAWLGEHYVGEHKFHGRSIDRQHVDVPMSFLLKLATKKPLVVEKTGAGRLYYRLGMQYAPSSLKLPPADHGFTVSRIYEGVDDEQHVRQDANGSWRVKAGALVRVRVNMVAPARRYHVALVDPFPAGFEPLNPALAVTGSTSRNPRVAKNRRPAWASSRGWFEHQNLRDERAEAFTTLLWDGVYEYTYIARATTPGRFVVPPPKAEEMYAPEVFGRGASALVIVE